MTAVTSFALLGGHRVEGGSDQPGAPVEPWYDAVDLALRTSDGRLVAFGLRTRRYLTECADPNQAWEGYAPIRTTLESAKVRYWDFNEVLWVGPSVWPCLVWSNADALSLRAISVTFAPILKGNLIAGPKGRGLPDLEAVGASIADDAPFYLLDTPAYFLSGSGLDGDDAFRVLPRQH